LVKVGGVPVSVWDIEGVIVGENIGVSVPVKVIVGETVWVSEAVKVGDWYGVSVGVGELVGVIVEVMVTVGSVNMMVCEYPAGTSLKADGIAFK
jgi:hypothetical protein